MTEIVAWFILIGAALALAYIMIAGGGPPSGNPHDPGIGGSL